MDRIEAYTDYRQFLRDFYEDRKKRSKSFSHRQFCRKAGLTSPSFLKEVIDGKRSLTDVSIAQFIQGLGLTDLDAAFFGALVRFNQATDSATKQQYLDQMRGLRRKVQAAVVPLDRYDYYSKWYHPVLRELAVHRIWNDDWAAMARCVRPQIKAREAREGIALLEKKAGIYSEFQKLEIVPPILGDGLEVSVDGSKWARSNGILRIGAGACIAARSVQADNVRSAVSEACYSIESQ